MGSVGRAAEQQTQEQTNTAYDNFRGMDTTSAGNYVDSLGYSNNPDLNQSNRLQTLTDTLGLHGKPRVMDDASFDATAKTDALDGVVLHRGIGYQNDDRVLNSIKFGDLTYQGDGIHGNGTYLTTKKSYARGYAGIDAKNTSFSAYIDKNRARVITESSLRAKFAALPATVQRQFSHYDTEDGISMFALHQGYNVISVPGGNGSKSYNGDFYVPLTRDVLVIRDHTLLK